MPAWRHAVRRILRHRRRVRRRDEEFADGRRGATAEGRSSARSGSGRRACTSPLPAKRRRRIGVGGGRRADDDASAEPAAAAASARPAAPRASSTRCFLMWRYGSSARRGARRARRPPQVARQPRLGGLALRRGLKVDRRSPASAASSACARPTDAEASIPFSFFAVSRADIVETSCALPASLAAAAAAVLASSAAAVVAAAVGGSGKSGCRGRRGRLELTGSRPSNCVSMWTRALVGRPQLGQALSWGDRTDRARCMQRRDASCLPAPYPGAAPRTRKAQPPTATPAPPVQIFARVPTAHAFCLPRVCVRAREALRWGAPHPSPIFAYSFPP